MPQQVSPFFEGKYGWNYGENGWNAGMDENLLKFSFMFDGNVDSVVSSLPAATNGASHFLTSDNRFYFAIGTTWYSAPCPKWFIFKIKSTGVFYQFNGSSASVVDTPLELDARLTDLEVTVTSLGTAAFEDVEFFATQDALDIVSAQSNAYTDTLRSDLANAVTSTLGTHLVGHRGRTLKSKLDQWIDVRDFGAVGDFNIPTETGTDDTAAIQAALDYIQSVGGGVLYFPEGQYRITSALSYANAPIEIIGAGIDHALIIQTTAAANGFNFIHTDVPPWVDGVLGHGGRIYSTIIRDLSITTTKQAGRAINVSIPPSTQNNTWVRLDRVAIKSLLYVTVGFQYGLFCHNVNGTKLDEFYFMGDAGNTSVDAAAPFYSQTAIVLEGDNAYGFISHYWRGVTVYAANRAVHITNHYEGIYLQQFEFGGVGEGIVIDPTTFTNFHMENGHVDFKAQGIFAKNVSGLRIVNVDFLKHGQSSGAHTVVGPNVRIELCNGASIIGGRCWSFTDVGNCNGIEIVDSIEFAIEGVDIKDMASTNRGISVSNGSKGVISGNTIKNVAAGIVISNASSEIVVANNVISEMAGTPGARFGVTIDSPATNITAHGNSCVTDVDLAVANNSAGNYIYDNTGGGAQFAQFADGDTTPAVDATGARTFTTANTGATSITAFDGGYVGLEINVIALDANTTIVDSGAVVPILTKSGANIVMALNDAVRFVRGPGAWYEV